MLNCGSVVTTYGNPPTYQILTRATPSDLGTCAIILTTGPEYKLLVQSSQIGSTGGTSTNQPLEINQHNIQDTTEMFYAFLIVLAAVWGIKQLINLFSQDVEK